jgi:HD superfamily phosphohydrolase
MFSDLYLHHAVKLAEAIISKATYFRMREEDLSRNESVGLFTRMTDGDLFRWLEKSELDFVREYAARIRYRKLFKVVLSRQLKSFNEDIEKKFRESSKDINKLIAIEEELSDELGSVIVDVVIPSFGKKKLAKIPLLVGGDDGFDLVELDDTEEGRPLMKLLWQQTDTIPSVRVYSDSKIASTVRRRFEKEFPVVSAPKHREDEYDLTEY